MSLQVLYYYLERHFLLLKAVELNIIKKKPILPVVQGQAGNGRLKTKQMRHCQRTHVNRL